MVSHVVEVELRLNSFLSENNFCKIDVISAKTQCIMTEKSISFHRNISVMQHIVDLILSAFFSGNNFCKIDVISIQSRYIMTCYERS